MRLYGRFIVPASVLLAALLSSACARSVEDFGFTTPKGRGVLRLDVPLPKGRQSGLLAPSGRGREAPRSTPRYSLDSPARVSEGEHFFLSYRSTGGPLTLRLFEDGESGEHVLAAELPSNPNAEASGIQGKGSAGVRFLMPLAAETRLTGFQVVAGAPSAQISIEGAGIGPGYPGVSFSPTLTVIREGVSVRRPAAAGRRLLEIGFAPLVSRLQDAQARIMVSYAEHGPGGTGRVVFTVADRSQSRSYRLLAHPGRHRLYLYPASCGFVPETVTISSSDPEFGLLALRVDRSAAPVATTEVRGPAATAGRAAVAPIPADFGTIIAYRSSWWRQGDFELFSWSLAPSVLVMKFRSLEVQSRYMKRLAFFVEKQGYAGRLWTNEQLSGRHGWNAHDYRSEDLARFFNAARGAGFPLNPEEQALRDLLLESGLIVADGESYLPGEGAIISFADSGSYELRRILLTHEGYHGIFFTNSTYRERILALWNEADPSVRELFRLFLQSKGYDAANDYLAGNEFGAYLLQQPAGRADAYFRWEFSVGRLAAARGGSLDPEKIFDRRLFASSALAIERALRETAGVNEGSLVELEEIEE